MKQNYFELLGLPQTFLIDKALLEKNYLMLLKEYHPDRFAQHTAQEKLMVAQLVATINTAKETLLSPVKRAVYLLQLHDVVIDLEQVGSALSTEFLTQQLEWREQLSTADDETKQAIEKLMKEQQEKLFHEFDALLKQATPDALNKARDVIYQLQFFEQRK